jgi:hypothetical protein
MTRIALAMHLDWRTSGATETIALASDLHKSVNRSRLTEAEIDQSGFVSSVVEI